MNNSPEVSVIVPCFNCESTVKESVGSIFNQTFTNFEIVLIDDGSRDSTLDVIKGIQQQHPEKVRVIQQKNQGVSVARNRGIAESKGQYITFLDSDDLYAPNKLDAQILEIKQSQVDAIFATIERFEDSPTGRLFFNPTKPPKCSTDSYALAVLEMDLFSYANFSTGLFKKSVFKNLKWNADRKTGEDWELWIQFAAEGFKAKNIDVTTNFYRKHDNNSTKFYDTYMTLDAHLSILSSSGLNADRVNQVAKNKVLYYSNLINYEGHKLNALRMYFKFLLKYPHSFSFSALTLVLKNLLLSQNVRNKLSRFKTHLKN